MTVRNIMSPLWLLLLVVGSSSFAVVAGGFKGSSADRPVASYEQVQAILNSNCVSCHSEQTRSSGLFFPAYRCSFLCGIWASVPEK